MKYAISSSASVILLQVLIVSFCITSCMETDTKSSISYPETYKDTTVVDSYHGTEVADPYRWLEDDYSDETMDWVKRQNTLTNSILSTISSRDEIKDRLTELWNFERYGTPRKEGEDYYYFKNDGLQNQSVLYRVGEEEDELILDPNTLSEDGTTSLGSISFSKDGAYMAYQISEGGSDWQQGKVMNLEDLSVMDDNLDWIKFSGMSWYQDGFFYSRYPAAEEGEELSGKNEYHSVYYHKLGTPQSDDVLIYRDNDHPQRNVYAQVDDSKTYLLLGIVESTSGNALKIAKLNGSIDDLEFVSIVDEFDADYSYVTTLEDKMIFTTNDGAPNQKVISLSLDNMPQAEFEVELEESENTLRWVTHSKSYFILGYLKDAHSHVVVLDKSFEEKYVLEQPTLGTVAGFRANEDDDLAYYAFTSYTYPTTIMQVDLESGESSAFKAPELKIDLDQFETKQIWFTSKDGTKVPMFVTQKKELADDEPVPTLLYGYGGFDIAIEPSFSVSNLILLEKGGRFAVANIRGGGEFGKEWHQAGTLERKQNVFDDFISAAKYLIDQKMTSPDLLAIEGGSNGGLLVGACMTQEPDLFAVAFPRVGVLDMLRYHQFTIGWAWATDYGRSDDAEAFEYLIKYSPLHNVRATDYPATMIMTADHDDRVVPAHSFKFAAELQDKHTGEDPVLIRIETSAGHGAGKPTSKRIEEEADKWGFMFHYTGEKTSH